MEAKSRGPGPKINLREDKMDNATLERMVQERCAAFAPPVAAAPAAPIPVLVPAREDPIDMETLSQLVDMRAALMPEDLPEEALNAPRVLPPRPAEVALSWEDIVRIAKEQEQQHSAPTDDASLTEGAAPPEDETTWEWTQAPDDDAPTVARVGFKCGESSSR